MKTKAYVALQLFIGLPLMIGCRGIKKFFIKGPVCNLYWEFQHTCKTDFIPRLGFTFIFFLNESKIFCERSFERKLNASNILYT